MTDAWRQNLFSVTTTLTTPMPLWTTTPIWAVVTPHSACLTFNTHEPYDHCNECKADNNLILHIKG